MLLCHVVVIVPIQKRRNVFFFPEEMLRSVTRIQKSLMLSVCLLGFLVVFCFGFFVCVLAEFSLGIVFRVCALLCSSNMVKNFSAFSLFTSETFLHTLYLLHGFSWNLPLFCSYLG